jgi:multiple sugar transport system substrate-binding protein
MRCLVVACVIALLAAGSAFSTGREEQVASEPVMIEVLNMDGGPGKIVEAVIPLFEKMTGIKVSHTQLYKDQLETKIMMEVAAKNDAFDVFTNHSDYVARNMASGALLALTDFVKKDDPGINQIFDVFLKPDGLLKMGGVLYALPYRGYSYTYIYRKDLFDAQGLKPPKTFEEMLAIAKKLNAPPTMYGAVLMGQDLYDTWELLLLAFGGEVHDGKFMPTLNSDAAVKATEYLIKLRPYMPEGYLGIDDDDIVTYMSQGTAAQTIIGYPYFETMNNPAQSKVSGKIDTAGVPGDVKVRVPSIVHSMGINPYSRHKEEAYKFIKFIMSNDAQKVMIGIGNLPVNRSTYSDPDVLAQKPFVARFRDAMENGYEMPVPPEWSEVKVVAGTFLSEALDGKRSVRDAVDRLQQEAVKIMRAAGRIK